MPTSVITLFLGTAVSLSGVDAKLRRGEPAKPAWDHPANTKCEELCKVDSGIDADARDCLTECASATDLTTHHLDQGFRNFAHDESYNEKGGEKILEKHNEEATEEVAACTPTVDLEKVPQFTDLDTNGDGVIDYEESAVWGEKACIPDEMTEQVFSEADINQDKVIDEDEFKEAGEDSKNEEAMDKALEKVSEGDDEYNSVQNPPIEEFDKNKDGALDESEAKDVFEHELERRTDNEDVPEETMKDLEPEVQDAIDEVDTDDDGEISGAEYAAKDEGSDLGTEMKEAAEADEDEPELDDLPRADGTAPDPPAASFVQRHRQRNSGFLRKHKASKKYALAAFQLAVRTNKRYKLAQEQLAQANQWQREAESLKNDARNLHKEAAKLRQQASIDRRHARSHRRQAGINHRHQKVH